LVRAGKRPRSHPVVVLASRVGKLHACAVFFAASSMAGAVKTNRLHCASQPGAQQEEEKKIIGARRLRGSHIRYNFCRWPIA
jgi:hypothetical protein